MTTNGYAGQAVPSATQAASLTVHKNSRLPVINMKWHVWQKMMSYLIAASPSEVNGFGIVKRHFNPETNQAMYNVEDVFILEQTANAGHAEVEPQAFHRFLFEYMQGGGDQSEICFQWHSHVNGGVRPSPTDDSTVQRWTGGFLISCIANLRGEHSLRVDWYEQDIRFGFETQLRICHPSIDAELLTSTAAEVAKLVKPKPVKTYAAAKKQPGKKARVVKKATQALRAGPRRPVLAAVPRTNPRAVTTVTSLPQTATPASKS